MGDLVPLLFAAAAIVCAVLAAWAWRWSRRAGSAPAPWIPTEATVTAVELRPEPRGGFPLSYAYEVDNVTYQWRGSVIEPPDQFLQHYGVGLRITVWRDPADPARSRPTEPRPVDTATCWGGLAFLTLLVAALALAAAAGITAAR